LGWFDVARPLVSDYPPGWSEYQRFRDDFIAILDPRFYTPEWLDGEIWSGRLRLFSCADSAIIVAVKPYPTGALELHGMAATGNQRSIVDVLIPQACAWGTAIGCIEASIESRPAWQRVMGRHGWQLSQVKMVKPLTAG
jgi:hypothetical protein